MQSNEEGFTLVELIVVMVIIGILAASALPRLQGLQSTAKVTKIKEFQDGLQASIEGAKGKGTITGTKTIDWEGSTVNLNDSFYPKTGSLTAFLADDSAFTWTKPNFWFQGNTNCGVEYSFSNGSYSLRIVQSEC